MTKTNYQLIACAFVGLSLVSCKKDSDSRHNNSENNTLEVYAGVHDSSFIHQEFNPPREISIVWDNQRLYGTGYDSVDLDVNGSYDLFITLHTINQDSLHLITGMSNPFPSCMLHCENGLKAAFYTESYPGGLGQTGTAVFVDRLDFEERIDTISDWKADIKMWSENPGGAGTPPFGDWYYASTENYIAFNMNGKYGWIEVNASDPKDPKIAAYAVQK